MRVATFNILNGRSPADQHVHPHRMARAIKAIDADVLALQEVDRNQPRSANVDLTHIAAEAMDAPEHRFVAALAGSPGSTWMAADGAEQPDDAAYGIALLSRHPVTAWQVIRLPAVPVRVPMRFGSRWRPVLVHDEPRVAVAADILSPLGPVTVVCTHLSFLTWWNRHQLRLLVRALAHHRRPLILAGDLNMSGSDAARLTGLRPLARHLTFPQDRPREQLDHLLLDGPLRAVASEAVELPISDHRALVVEIDH